MVMGKNVRLAFEGGRNAYDAKLLPYSKLHI